MQMHVDSKGWKDALQTSELEDFLLRSLCLGDGAYTAVERSAFCEGIHRNDSHTRQPKQHTSEDMVMRGMINGTWHRNLDDLPGWTADIATSLRTPTPVVGINLERLRTRPQSYHLYAARACPFAHRALIAHAVFGLDGKMPVTLADPWLGGPSGWTFQPDASSPIPEATALWEVYKANDPTYSGRVTVPVLWDRERNAIASTESDAILSQVIAAFSDIADRPKVVPAARHRSLGMWCDWIRDRVNIGVYRIGFARNQAEYDAARRDLAYALTELDLRLTGFKYVWGDSLSEADILLFPTAIRFDAAYQGAFMILDLRWRDFPGLQAHLETMLTLPGVQETVSFPDYRTHYFDDDAFTIRRPDKDGHYIVPRTPDSGILTSAAPMFGTAVSQPNVEELST